MNQLRDASVDTDYSILTWMLYRLQPTGPGATLYLALFGITLGFLSTFWAFSYVSRLPTSLLPAFICTLIDLAI